MPDDEIEPKSALRPHGHWMTVGEIDREARLRPRSTPSPVPDIPAERYDTCACGVARFMHDGRPISWLEFECAGPFVLAERLVDALSRPDSRCMDCGHVGPSHEGDCDRCGGPAQPLSRPAATEGGSDA